MQQYLELTTAPANDPITLADIKAHLRVGNTKSDDYLSALIKVATEHFDGHEGLLRRALITQTWTLYREEFHDCPSRFRYSTRVYFPLPPLQSVTSVKYYDENNVLQTFDAANYRVHVRKGGQGFLELLDDVSWPALYDRADAVQIEFVAGYGDDTDDVPAPLKHAIRLVCSDLWGNRGDAEASMLTENPGQIIKSANVIAAERLVSLYRWREFA